ncbi:Homeodomain-like domain-containing protein [Marinobacter sp. LV10R510-11A]|nr:Homeodomain-like domain-containing protein [Marinobacter sp. LV10R510-11A]
MRKIKEVLRLKWERKLSNRQIAAACGVSRPTVSEYLRRTVEAGLSWPLPADLDEAHLEQLLFPPPPDLPAQIRGIPDWQKIHEELRGKHVTLFLLWQEYREANPEGYQYSWYCEHYRAWQGKLDMVMRQDHRAGEKLFVDYAGQTVPVIDRTTGEIHEAQVFVAVMGASNYTYAEATWSQKLPDWIGSHIRAFQYLNGVPGLVIPDYVPGHIIGDYHLRNATEEFKGAHVTQQPVLQSLAPGGFRVGIIRDPQHGDKDLSRADFAGLRVDDGYGGAAIIHEALFTGLVDLAHGALLLLLPVPEAVTVLRVAVTPVGVTSGVLLPQQLLGDVFALEFLVNRRPVRHLIA